MVYTCSKCHNTTMKLANFNGELLCNDCLQRELSKEKPENLNERLLKVEAYVNVLTASVDALNRNLDKLKNDIRKLVPKNGGKK